ncbi:hypothetical protein J6590_105841 [Homalodisca vitripennis]|nr:hypothetical protein J6590_105841 [Homalodisca vitripennis]
MRKVDLIDFVVRQSTMWVREEPTSHMHGNVQQAATFLQTASMGRGIPYDSVRLFCGNPQIIHRAELVLVEESPKKKFLC